MGKPSAPKPSDPKQVAGTQTASNVATAIAQQGLNNMNQVTPYGNLSYSQTGTQSYTDPVSGKTFNIPKYTATQTFSPEQQALFDKGNALKSNMADFAGSRLDGMMRPQGPGSFKLPEMGNVDDIRNFNAQRVGGGPELSTSFENAGDITRSYGSNDFSADRQRVEDALMERMSPSLEQDRSRLENRLASQGIRIGSEAYNSAMDDFSRQSNDARMSAILNAGQEQSRMTGMDAARAAFENAAQGQQFSQNMATANFGNQAHQQMFQNQLSGAGFNNQAALQETNADTSRFNAANAANGQAFQQQMAGRSQDFNELQSLMGGTQVQNPNYVNNNAAQIAGVDYAGLQNNYDNQMQNQYQQQMGQWNDTIGGLFGLGSNLLMGF